ncbi:DUF4347 domain-containing protein [Microcoleus sp. AT9_B5]
MPNLNNQVSGSAIAFIDPQVENYQSLIAGVKPGTEVVVLDGNRDAIDQITEILGDRSNIHSIHIISHGAPGSLQLGNGCLSADNVETYSEKLQQWRSALTLGGDILIYGCNVASAPRACPKVRQGMNSQFERESRLKPTVYPKVRQGMNSLSQSSSRLKPTENKSAIESSSEDFRYETGVSTPSGSAGNGIDDEQAIDLERAIDLDGVAFIQRIAQLTNTNVAASKNLTGSVAKGGDWELEVRTGKIETPLVFEPEVLAGYEYVLNSFGVATNFGAGTNPYGIATGDFNVDGKPDLAVTNQGSDTVSILLGNGTGGFNPAPIPTLAVSSPTSIAIGNFNNDNFPDLAVVGGGTGGALSIFLGNGTGGFGSPTPYPTGVSPISVAVGKFNNDNFSDVAVVNASPGSTSGTVTILLANNTGSGALNFNTNLSAQSIPAFMTVGDFNGDTFSDLAVPNSLSNTISVFLANGSGDFGAATNLGAGTNPNSVANGDFNGDNFLDLAVVNGGSNNVSILLGNGTGGFGAANGFSAGTGLQGIVAKDFSGDGKLDLAVAGNSGAAILVGNGTGGFSAPINFAAGTDPTSIIVDNFNADTLPDLAVANNGSDNVSVLLNTPNTVSFVPPKIGNTYNVDEGTTDTVIDVPVTISGGTPLSDVTVPIVIDPSSTATQGADYTLSTTSLTFSAGTTTLTQNIPVTIKADNIVDSNEQIVLNFGTITGGVADASQGKVAILDRNSSYSIVADNPTVTEGNSGATPATFTITRNGSTELWSTVDYAITGTATNGTDYNNIGGTSGATAATGKISFAAGETSKTISLDVLGDGNIEPDETVAITLSNSVSPGGAPTIATATATATIKNDDTAGITVSPKAISTTEVGGKAEFTVKLNAAPTANVTIDLSGFNPAEGTVSPNSLTFTPANYSEQTITVTGVDDLVADGPQPYKIVTAAAVSTDANYNNLDPDDIDVTNSDNETPGITVNPTAGLTTGEDATKANFTVVLNTQPTADVTIGLNSNNVAEGTVSTNSITFTPANWNTAQPVTVTGVNDGIVDGDIGYKIVTAAAVTTDPNYKLDAADVSITNKDNDTAGISITPTATTATEGGAAGSYTLKLTSEPIAPVTINFNAGSEINAIAPITFDSTNWNVAKTVTVTATEDSKAEGTHTGTIAHTSASTDTKYSNLTISPVTATIADNDTAGVTISPTNITATEGGATGSYSVQLNSQPIAPVTISFANGDQINAIADVTFDATNWNLAKPVTVTATDDAVVEGNHTGSISHTAASADSKYSAIGIPGVTVAITDNDVAPPPPPPTPTPTPTPVTPTSVTPTPTPTPTPTSVTPTPTPTPTPTTVTPTPTPTPTPTSVTPTPTPTPTPTSVTPTPTPTPTPTTGTPTPTPTPTPTTGTPTPTPILGSPGIVISPASGLVTTEAGGTDQFTIRLNSQPTADVTIGLRSSNEAEGVISTESITFNSANWNQWQTITVTGVNDKRPEFDRDQNYQIVTDPAVSADSDYNGLDAPDALVTNRDNDIPGFNNNLPQSFTAVPYRFSSNELDQTIPGFVGPNAWGDYDNDGDLDLLVMEGGSVPNNYYQSFPRSAYTPKVYSNEGDQGDQGFKPIFKPIDIGLPTVYEGLLQENGNEHNSKPSATWGDSDNDGDLDILLIGVTAETNSSGTPSYIPTTTLWANPKIENNPLAKATGDATKFLPAAKLPGMFNGSADWGDYNNDGRKDLVLTGDTSSGYITKVFRNERIDFGGGIPFNYGIRFEEDTEVSLPGVIGNAAWGDSNNDGKLDILLAGKTAGSAYIAKLYSNTGNGFTGERNPLLQNQNNLNQPINYGAWGDSNNDGKLDILLTGGSNPSFTRVLLNNSNSQETKFEERWIPSGPGAGFGAWGDEDNDGDLDILLTETDLGSGKGVAKVYRNKSDSFEPIDDPTLPNNVYGPTSWGDYNKDGRLDIALTTKDDSSVSGGTFVKIYRNDTRDANTPPSAPQIFNSPQITQEGVVLSLPSESGNQIDSQTPNQGLSYNLRVWTTAPNGGEDIKEYVVGPMSLDDGTRQVVQLGNANQAGGSPNYGVGWLLKPDYLIPGRQYRWSVQVIDSARAGSPFVEGQPFTFTAPSIQPTVTISATDANAAETVVPPEEPNPGKFTITRTGGSLVNPLDVYYSLDVLDSATYTPKPGAAMPDMDYQLFSEPEPGQPSQPRQQLPASPYGSNIITIPAGKRSVNIDVDVRDDIYVEGNEKVVITLDPINNYNSKIGEPSSATVTIADNDPNHPPVLNYGETTTPWHTSTFKVSDSSTFTYTFPENTFTDPDPGDKLTYTATLMDGSPRPSWLNFDPNTRTLSGTSPIAQQLTIKLTATDRAGLSVSDDSVGDPRGMLLTFGPNGVVIDGYISGATLFLDANKNGILDTNEPSTTTDSGGKFNLNIPFETFDTNKNGEIDPEEGHLVATGGIDTATGLPLETPVTAPPDSSVVTLLTTLIADLIDKGIEPEEAQSLVKAALSLPAEVDLTSLDPILATNNNQPGGVQVLSAMVKVQNFITQTSGLIDGASSAVNTDIVKAVVSSITAQIQSGTVLNLSNAAALEPIIQQAAAKIQQIDPSFNTQQVSQITSQSATVMATANQRIDAAVSNPTGTSIPESLARIQQVALGPTTQDFKEVGTGNKPISQVVADNTGTALDSRIEAVVLPTGIATPVVSGDADLGSNSPDAILGTNGDDILTGDSANNVLMGMRGNDSLDGSLGNDSVFGGKGSDTILGSSGDDALFGNRGADILNGDDGNDILYGGKGDDLLNGGLGSDTLVGGMGVDKFLLSTNSGTDTITDFEVGQDLLVLGNGLTFSQLAIAEDSGSTLIRLAQTGEILASLAGVSASSISAVNFGLI